MSNAIFPTLPGLDITVGKSPEFNTIIQAAETGKELRISLRTYPIWHHKLKANFLRDTSVYPELKSLVGFYLMRSGPGDSFLFTDTDDSSVTDAQIGVGDGSNRDFQLLRPFGAFTEPVFNPNTITNVKVNGTPVTYALLSNGIVRLTAAAGNGLNVTWTGTFYFRSRFAEDKMDTERFLYQVWQAQRISLVSSLQDKI